MISGHTLRRAVWLPLGASPAWADHGPGHTQSTDPWVSALLWGGLGLVIFFAVYFVIHLLAARFSDDEAPR